MVIQHVPDFSRGTSDMLIHFQVQLTSCVYSAFAAINLSIFLPPGIFRMQRHVHQLANEPYPYC